jgi:TonB family protein
MNIDTSHLKQIAVIVFFVLITTPIWAQTKGKTPIHKKNSWVITQAKFPGGESGLMTYISRNLIYPALAKQAGIQGKVYVQFMVEADGHVDQIKILRGIGGGCDFEVVKLFRGMPKWTPATQNGERVNELLTTAVNFSLEK